MDTFSLTKVKSLFILTLIQRDDGDILLSMRMEVWLIIHIGSNWQRINGQRFINLRELRVAVGYVEKKGTIVESIRKKLCALSGNLQSRNRESHSLRI